MPTVRTKPLKIFLALGLVGILGYGGYQLYSNSTGALFSRAKAALEANQVDEARQLLERILGRTPDHLDALLMLSRIIFEEKNYAEAQASLKKVLSLEPNNIEARRMLSRIYLYEARFSDAREELTRIQAAAGGPDPGDLGNLALAIAGLAVGATDVEARMAEAEELLSAGGAALAAQPEANLARAILLLEAGDYEAALDAATLAKSRLGDLFPVLWVLGKARFYTGDTEGALAALNTADHLRSRRGVAPPVQWTMELYLYQGLTYIEMGQLDEAVRRLNIALENVPTAVEPTLAMVNLHLIQAFTQAEKTSLTDKEVQRLYRLAADALSRRKDLLKTNPAHHYQLALIELYLQNYKRALEILESLAVEEPPYLQALHELGDLYTSQAGYARAARIYRKILAYNSEDSVIRYNLGTILIRNHEVEAAREQLSLVVEAEPEWVDARLNHGLSCRLGRRFKEAEADYKAILAKVPDSMDALIGLGLIAWAQGDGKTANQYFDQVSKIHPDRSEPYYYLGQVALEEGKDAEARAMFEKCLSLDPENEYAALALVEIEFRRQSWAPARERLQAILDKPDARMKVVANNAMALAELMDGDPDAAGQRLASLEDLIPNLEPALVAAIRTNQAIFALSENRTEDAVRLARLALDTQPQNVTAHYNLGTIQLKAGKYSEAILSYRKALELDPDHEPSQYNLAVAQASLNQWGETQKILSRLAEKEESSIEIIRNLAEAYVGGGKPDEALEVLNAGLEKQPDAVDLRVLKAKALISVGAVQEARTLTEDLVKRYPQDWRVQMVAGIAAFLDGDVQEGETLLRHALQAEPDSPSLKLNLAILLIAKRDYKGFGEAEELLDEVENAGGRSAVIYNQRALLAFHRSDFAAARDYLQKSLRENPDQPKVEALFKQIEEL